MKEPTILVTLTGPSGSGKTVLLNKLVEEFGFSDIVSHTTRSPREGEVNGESYHFVTDEEFKNIKSNNGFIESIVFKGFKYGVSLEALESAKATGKMPVLIVEPTGLKQILQYAQGGNIKVIPLYIFHNMETLINRYLKRVRVEEFKDDETRAFHAARIASISDEIGWWAEANFLNSYITQGDISKRVVEDITYFTKVIKDTLEKKKENSQNG